MLYFFDFHERDGVTLDEEGVRCRSLADAVDGFPLLHKPYSVDELSRVPRQASLGKRKIKRDESRSPSV